MSTPANPSSANRNPEAASGNTPGSASGTSSRPPSEDPPASHLSSVKPRLQGPSASGGASSALGELDRVRDLLFGEHARETDERLERLEGRVEDRLDALQSDLQQQIDGLDAFAREEQESLADRVATQKKVHREDVNDLEREVQQLKRELAKAREELEDTLDQTERTFRERVHKQEKALSQQMADQHAELSSMIEAAVSRLRGDATDRRALADLFEQVATRLRE